MNQLLKDGHSNAIYQFLTDRTSPPSFMLNACSERQKPATVNKLPFLPPPPDKSPEITTTGVSSFLSTEWF